MYSFGKSAEKAYLEVKARGPLAHCLQIQKLVLMGRNTTIRFTFGFKTGIFTVFKIMGNILDPKHRLLIGIFWGLSSDDHFCSFFVFFSSFSLCLGKVISFYSLFSSRFFDQFWCLFSRSDCHTPTNYLRSHLGHRSTKILLWAVTLQI